MVPVSVVGDKILQQLMSIDAATCERVAKAGCRFCSGPLHRSDYPRKPRGGAFAVAGEDFARRLSLCCGWQGCRRRSTPPSVQFLGRRVYLGATVVLASLVALAATTAGEVKRATGVPARTVARWRGWWQEEFPRSRLFAEQRGRFMPPLAVATLPASLLERYRGGAGESRALVRVLGFLAPLTTTSVPDGSRFVKVE